MMKSKHTAIMRFPDRLGSELDFPRATPLADIYETASGFILKLYVPGAEKQGIRLDLKPGLLSVACQVAFKPNGQSRVIRQELGPRTYLRRFSLANGLDISRVEAELEFGVLTIKIPKSTDSSVREIPIN